jgi:iron(III) transport system ATP-binding protein
MNSTLSESAALATTSGVAQQSSAASSKPAVELRGIHKIYDGNHVVKGVDLSLPERSFLVLLGPSGCGKSTLLRMLSGLEAPSEGSLHILQREVANGQRGVMVQPGDRGLGLVFQSYALWPHMTVAQNVEWPLKVARKSQAERDARVTDVLKLMSIDNLAGRYPNEISGGQQQRVAIARMLSPSPSLLLFDEPLSNLDAKLRVEMRSELLRVHRTSGATSVYVTHDQIEAMTMATHVAVMKDGLVEQFGSPQELLDNPASAFVATFLGTPAANVLPALLDSASGSYQIAGVGLASAVKGQSQAQLMYRATDLSFAHQSSESNKKKLSGTLVEVAPMAGRYVSTVMVMDTRISVVSEFPPGMTVGEKVELLLPNEPRKLFNAAGKSM